MDENDIIRSAQLATAFEIIANPKPGNVHRNSDLKEETFEQFIAGSIVIGPSLSKAVNEGVKVDKNEITASEVRIGELVKEGVMSTKTWTGENTNLGVLLLLMPLTVVAGMTLGKGSEIEIDTLRKNLSTILKSTTSDDALSVYDAIQIASPGGLGAIDELSVKEESSKEKIKKENISLFDVMEISSEWDTIAREWVTDMQITFEEGFPSIRRIYEREKDLNSATVQTFLKILSDHPDSLVKRKYGDNKAVEISNRVKRILERGGMFSKEGRVAVDRLDEELKREDINPGTTADLIASSLMLVFLDVPKPVFSRN